MIRVIKIFLAFSFFVSNAYAEYWGDGSRHGAEIAIGDSLDPMIYKYSVSNFKKSSDNDDIVWVDVELENRNNYHLLCTIIGTIKITDGNSEAFVDGYVRRTIINRNQGRRQRFKFDKADFGNFYEFVEDSQKYKASCVCTDKKNLRAVPDLLDMCDPHSDSCDWTKK